MPLKTEKERILLAEERDYYNKELIKSGYTDYLTQWKWNLFCTFRVNSKSPEHALKALKKFRTRMCKEERMQVGVISVFNTNPHPHIHALFIGYSTKTGRSLNELTPSQIKYYEKLWPNEADIKIIGDTEYDNNNVCGYIVKNYDLDNENGYNGSVELLPDMGLKILNKTSRNKTEDHIVIKEEIHNVISSAPKHDIHLSVNSLKLDLEPEALIPYTPHNYDSYYTRLKFLLDHICSDCHKEERTIKASDLNIKHFYSVQYKGKRFLLMLSEIYKFDKLFSSSLTIDQPDSDFLIYISRCLTASIAKSNSENLYNISAVNFNIDLIPEQESDINRLFYFINSTLYVKKTKINSAICSQVDLSDAGDGNDNNNKKAVRFNIDYTRSALEEIHPHSTMSIYDLMEIDKNALLQRFEFKRFNFKSFEKKLKDNPRFLKGDIKVKKAHIAKVVRTQGMTLGIKKASQISGYISHNIHPYNKEFIKIFNDLELFNTEYKNPVHEKLDQGIKLLNKEHPLQPEIVYRQKTAYDHFFNED